jgi:hypothetical protein
MLPGNVSMACGYLQFCQLLVIRFISKNRPDRTENTRDNDVPGSYRMIKKSKSSL